MRISVTLLGLALSFLVTGCDSKSTDQTASKPARPNPVVVEEKCVDVSVEPKGQAAWLAQLPNVIQFKLTTTEKEGVVAEPVCVRDREHTPDWEDVVESSLFSGDSLLVSYARSVMQLESAARFAKLQELSLQRRGNKWTGKLQEVAKTDRVFDQALDYFLPIEKELTLPNCKTEQMSVPVDVPKAYTRQCR